MVKLGQAVTPPVTGHAAVAGKKLNVQIGGTTPLTLMAELVVPAVSLMVTTAVRLPAVLPVGAKARPRLQVTRGLEVRTLPTVQGLVVGANTEKSAALAPEITKLARVELVPAPVTVIEVQVVLLEPISLVGHAVKVPPPTGFVTKPACA
jgi:hypothetical protein